jgi:hypothetical protein
MKPDFFLDQLGGTTEVARLCHCTPQAVSQWRAEGIPIARLLHLKLLRPDLPWQKLVQPEVREAA